MTNDINTENEKLRKMLEEQKRENEHQKLVNENQRLQILNLEREKELRVKIPFQIFIMKSLN